MRKIKLLLVITILAASLVALRSAYFYQNRPIARLRRELGSLREGGIPVESVEVDDELGCLVVNFKDMEPDYVEPIREVVGYDQQVLFRELEPKMELVGEPPAPVLEICGAMNALEESWNFRDYLLKEIDVEKGLLRLRLKDLTDEKVQAIMRLVGYNVPVLFEEIEWKDRLYVGRPSLDTEALEDAISRLDESDQTLPQDAIHTEVDEEDGFLKISFRELEDYRDVIEAIRNVVGQDTPVEFVFTHYPRYEKYNFTTPEAALEHYMNLLNLTDLNHEIVKQTEEDAEASLYFLIGGERFQFQQLRLRKEDGSWIWDAGSKGGIPSPSREVEIVGYLIRVVMGGGRKVVSRVTPMVKNHGNRTAYIWTVGIEVRNSTHTYNQTYHTVGMDIFNGLIRPGQTDIVGTGGHHRDIDILLDQVRGKTYAITITLKDGEENTLAEKTFVHTVSTAPG